MKFCINCQYFGLPELYSNKYNGFCKKYPKTEETSINYLVTGISPNPKYVYCSIARDNSEMCGVEGRNYKKKYIKIQNFTKS